MKTRIHPFILAALLGVVFTVQLHAQGPAFIYQGRLTETGVPFTGSAEFQFTLWDAETGGTAVATNDPPELIAPVSNGLFTVALDFGDDAFHGSERFLQIEVRTSIGEFTTLNPRQPITPAPQAIYASTAAQSMSVDSGTISNPSFIGTTTNTPLDLFANNLRALRLEDSGADNDNDGNPDGAPNVIGGAPVNSVAPDIAGATISGGGAANFVGLPEPNTIEDDYGAIGGGLNNTAGRMAFVGGGRSNTASGEETVVGGGLINRATDQEATVAGGSHNTASGLAAAVGGGRGNIASGNLSAIGGGRENTATGGDSTVPGGENNSAAGTYSLAAGRSAKANHRGTFVWGDSRFDDFASIQDDEFAIRARNGVRVHNQGNGKTLLRLETERPWEFRQIGSGADTALELVSLDSSGVANKDFIINTTGGGSVGIGTTAPGFTLHVNGSAGKPGGGSWSSASDARLKETRQPFTRGLAALEKLTPTHYRYAPDNALDLPSDREYVGLIAQDVQAAIPEAIESNETGYLHLNNDPIHWTMLNGIKELNDRSQRAEAGVEQLRAENAELRQELQELKQLIQTLTMKGTMQ